jgi:hypothetical protein
MWKPGNLSRAILISRIPRTKAYTKRDLSCSKCTNIKKRGRPRSLRQFRRIPIGHYAEPQVRYRKTADGQIMGRPMTTSGRLRANPSMGMLGSGIGFSEPSCVWIDPGVCWRGIHTPEIDSQSYRELSFLNTPGMVCLSLRSSSAFQKLFMLILR